MLYADTDKSVARTVLDRPPELETEAEDADSNGEEEGVFTADGRGNVRQWEVDLLARLVEAEAEAEPYVGKVAVAAVMINRVESPSFPGTLSGVVYQPLAFESVMNGRIWRVWNFSESQRAARAAMNGWDPTWGSLYFWNPATATSRWVWSRQIVTRYGRHVFAR